MTDLIPDDRVRFGPYEADLRTKELWKFGTRLKLVGQPFEILAVLVTRPGELVTREELQEKLWPGETFVDFNHGLNAAVNKLRDVLSDSADDPKYIETLPRRGYRFVAKVERGADPAVKPKREVAVEIPQAPIARALGTPTPSAASIKTGHPEVERRQRSFPKMMAGIGTVGVLLLATLIASKPHFLGRTAIAEPHYTMDASIKGAQRILATEGRNEGPQYSPDGSKVVFMSNRGDGMNLWLCKTDGSDAHALTTLGDAGTPRWSPDGHTIAFDASFHNHRAIMLVDANGDTPRILMAGDANNSVPSWSRDGKFIYFASDRTGRYEVWKVSAAGGTLKQVTHEGGFAGFESEDGKTFYYARNEFPGPELWSVPTEGGAETVLAVRVRPVTWAAWGVARDGIYFVEEGANNIGVLSVANLQTNTIRQLTVIGRFPFWLGVAEDGSKVAFDRAEAENTSSLVQLQDIR